MRFKDLLLFLSLALPNYYAESLPVAKPVVGNCCPFWNVVNRVQDEDINSKDETGLTPLMQAAQDGRLKHVQTIITKGADVNMMDQYGWTSLTYRVAGMYMPVVNALLEHGANINAEDNRGRTILMWASTVGNAEIVRLLISKGADVNAQDNHGATALSFANAKGHKNVARLLIGAGGTGPEINKDTAPKWPAPIDRLPELRNQPMPHYTDEARARGIQGIVYLRALFDTDGKVRRVKVLVGLPMGLTENAVKVAYKLRAKPAMDNGQPVEYWVPVQVEFNVRR